MNGRARGKCRYEENDCWPAFASDALPDAEASAV